MNTKATITAIFAILLLPAIAQAELPCTDYEVSETIVPEQPTLNEISGLAVSHNNPNYLWGHTDSGGEPELYLFDRTGKLIRTYRVENVTNYDWEDLAVAPCQAWGDKYCIYIADTGDNLFSRQQKRIHSIEEPLLPEGEIEPSAEPESISLHQSWRIQYPDNLGSDPEFANPDCESLMVHPQSAEIYIVSKQSNGGTQNLFKMTRGGDNAGSLTSLASYTFTSVAGRIKSLFNATTSADFAPDGYRFVVRTYAEIYEYDLVTYPDIGEAFKHPAKRFGSSEPQGESVSYDTDGKSLITSS